MEKLGMALAPEGIASARRLFYLYKNSLYVQLYIVNKIKTKEDCDCSSLSIKQINVLYVHRRRQKVQGEGRRGHMTFHI